MQPGTRVASKVPICLNGLKSKAVGAGVSKESEGQDTGAEAVAGGVDPAAVALALGGASRERADSFLKDQQALIADQRHHLYRQLTALDLGIWEKRFGLLLRIATGFVGLAVAAGLAFMIWDASQSSGLLIEPFSVPPDLAARGMTGQVVAAKLLDHLSQMQAETNTSRAAQSYANDWGQAGIKLDIPETGVSLTELDDFLREKLGHDTHITGEIVRTATGVSLTARTGGEGAETVTGSEADLDGLVRQLSENIYRLTQPFRYGIYLAGHDRIAEALPVMKALAESGSTPVDRAYGYTQWGDLSAQLVSIDTGLHLLQQAMAVEPENLLAQLRIVDVEKDESLPEQSRRDEEKSVTLLASNKLGIYTGQLADAVKRGQKAAIDELLGDFQGSAQHLKASVQTGGARAAITVRQLAQAAALDHDLAMARTTIGDFANYRFDPFPGNTALQTIIARMLVDGEAQDWAGVLSEAEAIAPMVQKYPGMRSFLPTTTVPLTAYAEAKLGKIADAEAHLSATPADCYDCLIARARIAEVQGQHGRADDWFARAIDGQKSIPFAYTDWGQCMLDRGKPVDAIEKFTIANQRGPHFADPLEMWGEALMAKNQSHLALTKFEEADKYAPNWGRLHLKWGEALGYAGRKDEARVQYQKASRLDLTAADKAELARDQAHA